MEQTMIEATHWLIRLTEYRKEMAAKKAEIDALFPGREDPEARAVYAALVLAVSPSTTAG
jgi:hypothetical protein